MTLQECYALSYSLLSVAELWDGIGANASSIQVGVMGSGWV